MDLPHNKLVSVLAAILLSVCMCACSDKENQVIPYYRVSISYDQLYLAPGDSIGIHYHVAQYGRTIEIVTDYQNPPVWRSSNPTIATVDKNGIVRAVSPGICTISLSFTFRDNIKYNINTCQVEVLGKNDISLTWSVLRMSEVARPEKPSYYIMTYEMGKDDENSLSYLVFPDKLERVLSPSVGGGVFKADKDVPISFSFAPTQYPEEYARYGSNSSNNIIEKLNEVTGLNFRLPTLEEWQFAAGGGLMGHGFIYSGSDNIDEVGWYVENFPFNKGYYTRGSKMANELGLFDCSGGLPELVTMPKESESPYAVCGGFYRAAARYCGVNSYEPAYLNGHDRVRYGGTSCGFYGLRLVLDSI